MVATFLGFLVSLFQSFLVSLSQGFKNPLMFLKDIGSIVPNYHFMFFGRDWSHIKAFQHFVSRSIFSNVSKKDFRNVDIYIDNNFENDFGFS